jgi:hypothetical protein
MVENPYLQFPLCLLSFEQTVNARLNTIINYCMVEVGSRLFRKLTAEEQRKFLCEKRWEGNIPRGFNSKLWLHRAMLYGAHVLLIVVYDVPSVLDSHRRAELFISDFEKLYRRDSLVRIKSDWVFNARDKHGIDYREFSVLCAIYSAIGDKELAIVTRNRIQHCAMGYRTAAIMWAEIPRRADKAQPLTERKLRDTVARLHRNRFFARCTVFRRITYYSIRLDNEAMRKRVLERRTYPEYFRVSQASQDQALTEAIRRKRREAAQSELTTVPPAAV